MNWTDEKHARLARAFESGGVLAVADLALELAPERCRTMTEAVVLPAHLSALMDMTKPASERLKERRAVEALFITQGATVATLQEEKARMTIQVSNLTEANADLHRQIADVARARATLQARVEEMEARIRQLIGQRDDARAEVERLKAEVQRLSRNTREAQAELTTVTIERNAAESRLAAMRERGNDPAGLRRALEQARADGPDNGATPMGYAVAAARWVLEGDAPQEGNTSTCYCLINPELRCFAARHPCSATCTHNDAATPGHPERVKERSEAWHAMHPNGACTCGGEGTCAWCSRAGAEVMAMAGGVPSAASDALGTIRSFLADGEPPCTCAGTVDGDSACLYCNAKQDARDALEALSEAEYAKGWNDAVAHVEERVRNALESANAQVLAAIEGAVP